VAIATWLFPIVQRKLSSLASDLPVLFAQLIVVIFFTYYILMDGQAFVAGGLDLFPKQKQRIMQNFLQELNSIYNTLFTVYFTTSMLSGVLAAIGFSLLGISYPFVLGVVVGIFTLIPMLGPPFVFIPIALYHLFLGDILRAIIIVLFGTVVLMVIPENVLRPHLAMKSARIHPIVTLLAYTAPIFVVGLIGVILGPTLYGFLLAAYRAVVNYRDI
jgi:predicted PurR-regulated permease PerM